MRVVISGATGTLGGALLAALLGRGDEVVALTRDPRAAAERLPSVSGRGAGLVEWPDPPAAPPPAEALAGADAVVNLLGEPISQRWTPEAKRRIRESRVDATRNLVAALHALA